MAKKRPLTFYEGALKIKQAGLGEHADLIYVQQDYELLPLEERLPLVDKILRKAAHKKVDTVYTFITYDIENNKDRNLIKNGWTVTQLLIDQQNLEWYRVTDANKANPACGEKYIPWPWMCYTRMPLNVDLLSQVKNRLFDSMQMSAGAVASFNLRKVKWGWRVVKIIKK